MEEKINMRHFHSCLIFPLFLLLVACTGPGLSTFPTEIGPTVTIDPDPSPSLTPFGPLANTATSLPSPQPTEAAANLPTLQPTDTATNLPTPPPATPTTIYTPLTTLTPGASPAFVPSKYTLSVMLDYAGHTVTTDETIGYFNSTGETVNDLVLAVEPNLWKGCFVPSSITVNGQDVSGVINLNGDRLEVPLATPLSPNDSLELYLHFDLHLPAADVYHVFGYNSYQINLVDWYPFIVPFVPGQGWLYHPPANVGEHLAYDVESFDVTLQPDRFQRACSHRSQRACGNNYVWLALSPGECALLCIFYQHRL